MEFDNEGMFNSIVNSRGFEIIYSGGNVQAITPLCPYCYAESSPRNIKASFGNFFASAYGGWGFKCFSCDNSCSLIALSEIYSVDLDTSVEPLHKMARRAKKPQMVYTWQDHVDTLVDEYASDETRYQEWWDYKGLDEGAVDTWSLGVGSLPETRHNERRLITPIHNHSGDVCWLRGRVIGGEGMKWVGAGGFSPTSLDLPMGWLVQKGKPLILVENYIDALAINYYLGDRYSAVPTFSVTYWSERWAQEIVDRKPSQVLVAFDPDLAGNGPVSNAHARQLFAQRIAKRNKVDPDVISFGKFQRTDKNWQLSYRIEDGDMEKISFVRPFGIQRAEHLLKLEVPAKTIAWQEPNLDIGDFLAEELKSRRS